MTSMSSRTPALVPMKAWRLEGDHRIQRQLIWKSWPPTARWCIRLTFFQISSCVLTHLGWTVGPAYQAYNQDEIELFSIARYVLMIPLMLVTVYNLIEWCTRRNMRALVISHVCMFEFSVKISYYSLLSTGYGLAYQNQRAYDLRPIYATRWIGWTFAIPTLLFMNLYPLLDHHHPLEALLRILPQQAASAAYCWACFLGCVVTDPLMGWYLNTLGCVAYVVVIADEMVLVYYNILETSQPVLKGYSIIVKECVFIIYTFVWLFGNWGYATSYSCQRFYTVTDISLKSTMAALLFYYWNVSGETTASTAEVKEG